MADQYLKLYKENKAAIWQHAPEIMNARRDAAWRTLESMPLPRKGDEGYPALSVAEMFAPDYGVNINRVPFGVDLAESFSCGVPNVSTLLAVVSNDIFVATASLLRNLPQGVMVTSIAQAAKKNPDLVKPYYDKLASQYGNAATAINTLLAQDGIFIHVDTGVELDKPIQIVNIFNATAPMMAPRRVLIVMEQDAHADVLVCDHSANKSMQYLDSQVVEIFLDQGASLQYYDLEESSAMTMRHSQLFAEQNTGSSLVANGTTLMGGTTCNSYCVDLQGEHCTTKLAGMAIGGPGQVICNNTRITHNVPKCHSDQMYKYILDGNSQGSFYGIIKVDEAAKFTKAYQSNRNILANADAKMYTRPQLEIYCDEVKCSHGATIGQLDQNALFYMRQRGIPEAEARMMLMQAFMADVIDTVEIPALKSRLHQLVEMRLSGNHQLCEHCQGQDAASQHAAE